MFHAQTLELSILFYHDRLVDGVELLAHILHPSAVPAPTAAKGVLKLALSGGQRCRQRLMCNYFMPLQ